MNDENNDSPFHDELESVSSIFIEILNNFNRSETLQNFFIDVTESLFYSEVIKNFFSNLNDENVKEYKLSSEDVDNLRNEFKETLKDVNLDLSTPLKKKINEEYYNSFKDKIREKFPDFLKIIKELENIIDMADTKKFLDVKKEDLKKSGKNDDYPLMVTITKALESFVNENKFFPDLDDPKFKEFLEKFTKNHITDFFGMEITDWNIWHSYCSFYIQEPTNESLNLEVVAKKLVEEDLCPLVFSSNTNYWFKENSHVKKLKVEINQLDTDKFGFKTKESPPGYPAEVLYQALSMWYAEWRLFSDEYKESLSYIRCFLNPCYLKKGERTVVLYPQIKIYANGVFILTFREIGPKDFTYYLEPFIENEINLPKIHWDAIELPPEIIKFKGISKRKTEYSNLPIHKKIRKNSFLNDFLKDMETLIEKNTKLIEDGDFSFHVFTLNPKKHLRLTDLSRNIISAFTYIINQTSNDFRTKKNFYQGNYWILRPSVYLIEFNDQPDTSSEIIEKYDNQLGKIMTRISGIQYKDLRQFLGENLRDLTFEDFTLHLNEALTLWTISKRGHISRSPDSNMGHIIYEKQIQEEAINHLYMSHRRLFQISSIFSIPYESVLLDQWNLLNLEALVTNAGRIGNYREIDFIMNYASEVFHWDVIRNNIEKQLKLRSEYSNEERNKILRRFGYIITFIFGLGSLTIFAINVTIPFLNYFQISISKIPEIENSLVILIFIVIIITILLIIFKMSWRRKY